MPQPIDRVTEDVLDEVEDSTGLHVVPELEGPLPVEAACIWYFAFGSNMNEQVLRGRRSIVPAESAAAVLHGYRLVFDLPGLPWREPAFASVEPILAPGSAEDGEAAGEPSANCVQEVHGVVFRITPTQWDFICRTEGAAGTRHSSYDILSVTVDTYDGRALPAFTLTTSSYVRGRYYGKVVHPSARYLSLIRQGACNHGLSPDYLKYLDSLPKYTPVTLGQRLAYRAMLLTYLGLMSIFLLSRVNVRLAALLTRKKIGMDEIRRPGSALRTPLSTRCISMLLRANWFVHDWVAPIIGSGAY